MAAARRKKGRRHPGVVLIKPEGRHGWRARYNDPDTGKVKKEALPAEWKGQPLTQAEQRAEWAAEKSAWIAKRKAELEAGAVPSTGQDVATTIEHYFTDHTKLDANTLGKNRVAANKLIAFCERLKLRTADDITQPVLLKFRAHLVNEPKRKAKAGGKVGQFVSTNERRAPKSVNGDIGAAVTVLRYLRKLRLLSRITFDDIETSLAKERIGKGRIDFMKPAACRNLITLALDHDAETFRNQADRDARDKGRPIKMTYPEKGSKPVYDPIAPFVLFVLVTGVRVGEALALEWAWVDLDAQDEHGKPVGEIHLPPHITKTRNGRTLVLEVGATLRPLLIAMQPEQKLRHGSVFNVSPGEARAALERIQAKGHKGAWHQMRRTCATYLTNSGVFPVASAWRSAKQLGHGVNVAERDYADLIRISRDARTLEAAMQIEKEAGLVLAAQQARTAKPGKLRVVAAVAQLN